MTLAQQRNRLVCGVQIYLWAPIYRENWSAFAPDFEELEENREYVEREDEFDINEREEDRLAAAAAANAAGVLYFVVLRMVLVVQRIPQELIRQAGRCRLSFTCLAHVGVVSVKPVLPL